MKQSRIDSIYEAITNILIGAGIALIAQLIWFPIIGKDFTMNENLLTMIFFTFISFIRSYSIRRLFNGKSVWLTIKYWYLIKTNKKLCSGYGIYPNGIKCIGCTDCKHR